MSVVIGDVVAVVAQRRRIERQQPDRGHAEVLQIVELRGKPAEIADAVAVAVVERADVELVDDRVLVPLRGGGSVDFLGLFHNRSFHAQDMGRLIGRIKAHVVALRPLVAGVGQQVGDPVALAGSHSDDCRAERSPYMPGDEADRG